MNSRINSSHRAVRDNAQRPGQIDRERRPESGEPGAQPTDLFSLQLEQILNFQKQMWNIATYLSSWYLDACRQALRYPFGIGLWFEAANPALVELRKRMLEWYLMPAQAFHSGTRQVATTLEEGMDAAAKAFDDQTAA